MSRDVAAHINLPYVQLVSVHQGVAMASINHDGLVRVGIGETIYGVRYMIR